jgi:hypothetical protein
MYGGASNSDLFNNTIISPGSGTFKTFRIGSKGCDDCVAKNIKFRSNKIEGQEFGLDVTDQDHTYSVYWTLNVLVKDKKGIPLRGKTVAIYRSSGEVALKAITGDRGEITAELPEYEVDGKKKIDYSPYTIIAGGQKKLVYLEYNKEIIIQ